jgi:DNA-binding NarL/FixJ family response regulator
MTHAAMRCRLLVAEGRWLLRCGLMTVLGGQPGLDVRDEADSGEDTLRKILMVEPDLVLLDLDLPGGGLTTLEQIKRLHARQRVLVMGEIGAFDEVRAALRAGADGYVRKSAARHELLEAVRCVAAGQAYIEADLARELVLDVPRRQAKAALVPLQDLTERELSVFRLIGLGYTTKAAADHIGLSHRTVEKHRAAVMQKLKLRNALQLRLLAAELRPLQGPVKVQDNSKVGAPG